MSAVTFTRRMRASGVRAAQAKAIDAQLAAFATAIVDGTMTRGEVRRQMRLIAKRIGKGGVA